jgi:hypothetical protein
MMSKEICWKPEINDEVEGILVDKLDDVGIYHSVLYKIQDGDKIINIWGKKQLNSLMELTNIGDKIKIRYVGNKEINNHMMNLYELEILNEDL